MTARFRPLQKMLAALFVAVALVPLPTQAGDPIVLYEDTDPQMNAAIEQARATLPHFFEQLATRGEEIEYFAIKVAVPTTTRQGSEHIWMSPFAPEGDGFVGALSNAPNDVEGRALGDMYEFSLEQVSDWTYYVGGRQYGAYTLRVMLPRLPPAQAAEIEAGLAPLP